MTGASNKAEYAKRMHRALEHIDRHIDQTLELAELAEVAHFSPFHFHRVFTAWLGETFGDYLRRRRLEVAATRLIGQPRVPVLSIALSVGFGSSEAFCRAFKVRFGLSPTAWRRREIQVNSAASHASPKQRMDLDGNCDQLVSKANQAGEERWRQDGAPMPAPPRKPMKVTVIDRPAAKVAYLRHVGPYGESLSQFWQDTVYPWMVTNSLLGKPRYGVSHDDPSITAWDKCRYDAAVEITGALAAPGEALMTTLPGGKCGITHFRGTAGQIGPAWTELLRHWLPASGLQLDARPFIEYYGPNSSFDPNTGVFTCELAIPVAPL